MCVCVGGGGGGDKALIEGDMVVMEDPRENPGL